MAENSCVNIERNKENCTCGSEDCGNYGLCCECIVAHSNNDSLPSCLRIRIQDSQAFRSNLMSLIEKAGISD